MKQREKRITMVTYCDKCKKELKGSFTIIKFPFPKSEMHFCSIYTPEIHKTCYDKYKEEEFKKYKS